MCGGIEIALIAGSLLSSAGAVMQGQQQKKMASYQAAQADADAAAVRAQAKVEAERLRKAGAVQASQANAALAASGVETGEGTALRITSDIAGDAEQDAYLTILNGEHQSARLKAQARGYRISGNNAAVAGYINAGGSLIRAGGTGYSGWKKAQAGKYGIFAE